MIHSPGRHRPAYRTAAIATVLLVLAALWAFLSAPAVGQGSIEANQPPSLPIVAGKANCSDLSKFDVARIGGTGSRITSATETAGVAGAAVCSVTGTLAPAVTFRVDLPLRTWTQRYLQTGCGGLCGSLNINVGAADGCPTVAAGGFVLASTDMGHEGMSAEFGLDPQKRADFAYRGVHLTAVTAKALIRAFYGQGERFSYFDGCSDGGREALVEAQRFPQDFNGIIAGAPAMNFTVQNSLYHGWQARSNTGADGKAILIAPRLSIIHGAVLKACDSLDGQTDGLVSVPGQCRFDPMKIVCKPGQDPSACLTQAEAMVARSFYDGPRDPKTGERLTQGGPLFGSELQWAGVYVPQSKDQPIFSTMIANGSMANLLFADGRPATVDQLTFDRVTFDRAHERHALFDATNPDLSAFAARGGKLILFHGWADPHISPLNTIAYHDAVRKLVGAAKADGFERLYLMPGMGHCSGGEGPSAFDLLSPMMAWVEAGSAPDAIVTRTPTAGQRSMFGLPGGGSGPAAAKGMPAGMKQGMAPPPGMMPAAPVGPARTRPVYPYPYVASFQGAGDPNAAAGWTKGKAAPVEVPSWAGKDNYKPYTGVTA